MCDIVVDAKQVLDYLRNLGYTDIDKDQFKCFLKGKNRVYNIWVLSKNM